MRTMITTCSLLALAVSSPLAAQPADTGEAVASDDAAEAGEIVVTARKRTEALSDVPVTVTALSDAEIEARGIENLEDVASFAPGFNYSKQGNQRGGRAESVIRFRGMDINDVAPNRQLASVFVDGVYVAGGLSSLSFEDVARVEVIKGPQSAYFGRSTFGGAVNFISKSPDDELGADFVLSAAEDSTYDVAASLEGGLGTDRLRGRVTGRYYTTDGRFRSIADAGRLGEEETQSINLILDADPLDNVRLTARAFFAEDEDGPPPTFALTKAFHNCGPFFPGGVTYICGELPKVENFGTNTQLTPATFDIFVNNSRNSAGISRGPRLDHVGLRRKVERYSLAGDIDIEPIDATLSIIGGHNKLRQARISDLDFTPANIWLEYNFQLIKDWSAEARLAGEQERFDWLIGASVFDLRFDTPNGSIGYLFPNTAFPNGFFLNQTIGRTDVKTYAAFGSVAWRIADEWTLSAEGRYQEDEVDQGVVANVALAKTFKNFLPRVILQWQPDDDTNLYVTYAKGNKPGDFNTTVVGLTPAQKDQVRQQTGAVDVVEEEELDNYEVGLKKSVADGAVSFNLAGYYMQWKNQQNRTQATITDPTTPAGIRFVPVIISAGETDLWGVEAEATARLSQEWTLSGTFNWAASEYKVFECGFCQRLLGTTDMSGKSSPRFPEFSGTASLAYDTETSAGLGLFARADTIFTGQAYDEAFNLAHTSDAWRVNVRAGVQRDIWRAEVFVNNVFNNDDYVAAARFTDFTKGNFNLNDFVTNVTPAEPRQLGVRVRVGF